jgi:hypothetical protein
LFPPEQAYRNTVAPRALLPPSRFTQYDGAFVRLMVILGEADAGAGLIRRNRPPTMTAKGTMERTVR